MLKPFGGTSSTNGEPPAVKSGDEIWMSWFESGLSTENHGTERNSERFSSSEREHKVSIPESHADLESESSSDLGGAGAGERYSSMRQEIDLAQRRAAVRASLLDGTQTQPSYSTSLPSMALWGTSALQEKRSPSERALNASISFEITDDEDRADAGSPAFKGSTLALESSSRALGSNAQHITADVAVARYEQSVSSVTLLTENDNITLSNSLPRPLLGDSKFASSIPPVPVAKFVSPVPVKPVLPAVKAAEVVPDPVFQTPESASILAQRANAAPLSTPSSEGKGVAEKMAAAFRIPAEKATREMLAVDISKLGPIPASGKIADRIPATDRASIQAKSNAAASLISQGPVSPFGMSETLRGADSESSKLLAQHGLYDKFSSIACHEHISWGPDGSVSVALKSSDGYRRTIVCRADGTSAQRIADPNGKEILRFASNGQVVRNLDNPGIQSI